MFLAVGGEEDLPIVVDFQERLPSMMMSVPTSAPTVVALRRCHRRHSYAACCLKLGIIHCYPMSRQGCRAHSPFVRMEWVPLHDCGRTMWTGFDGAPGSIG